MGWRLPLFFAFTAKVWACSCAGTWPSAKQAWQNAPFVFVGTVELADPNQDSSQTIFQEQAVRIHVDEAFKGIQQGQTIELRQGGTDCDAKFRTSQRAVFYLVQGRTPGTYFVPWCTRALGNAENGSDDLLFLRGLPASAKRTRLSGEVELYEDSPAEPFHRIGAVPDVKIKITGGNGLVKNVVTNSAGAYELFRLPQGRYSVSIQVPERLKQDFAMTFGSQRIAGDDSALSLKASDNAGVSFVLKADTHLSGRLIAADGLPADNVCLNLLSLDSLVEDRGFWLG